MHGKRMKSHILAITNMKFISYWDKLNYLEK